ncbi:MAG: hypothetical protein GY866_24035 [Proteobacteria bacterium]|nr:hypothetical protein [Pseudomonadota bacterium]
MTTEKAGLMNKGGCDLGKNQYQEWHRSPSVTGAKTPTLSDIGITKRQK